MSETTQQATRPHPSDPEVLAVARELAASLGSSDLASSPRAVNWLMGQVMSRYRVALNPTRLRPVVSLALHGDDAVNHVVAHVCRLADAELRALREVAEADGRDGSLRTGEALARVDDLRRQFPT